MPVYSVVSWLRSQWTAAFLIKVMPCKSPSYSLCTTETSRTKLTSLFDIGASMQNILQATTMTFACTRHSEGHCKNIQHHKEGNARLLSKDTTVLLRFLHYSQLSRHAAHMAQYKPGAAIGSTGGWGSTRNQREMLRTPPPALANLLFLFKRVGHIAAVRSGVPLLLTSYLHQAVWTGSPRLMWHRKQWLPPSPRCTARCGSAHRWCCSQNPRPTPRIRPRRPLWSSSCKKQERPGEEAESVIVGEIVASQFSLERIRRVKNLKRNTQFLTIWLPVTILKDWAVNVNMYVGIHVLSLDTSWVLVRITDREQPQMDITRLAPRLKSELMRCREICYCYVHTTSIKITKRPSAVSYDVANSLLNVEASSSSASTENDLQLDPDSQVV